MWTAPRTWVAGEVVTAPIMNTHIRDNLLALFTPSDGWPANPIVKTGRTTGTTDGGGHVFTTFSTPFPTACDRAIGIGSDTNSITVAVNAKSATQIDWFFNAASVARSVEWVAIGH